MRTRSLLLSVAAVGLLGAGVGRAEVFNEYDPAPPFSSGAASIHKKKDRLTAVFPNVEWGLMIR
jgi:hypothetical protein